MAELKFDDRAADHGHVLAAEPVEFGGDVVGLDEVGALIARAFASQQQQLSPSASAVRSSRVTWSNLWC